MSTNNKSTTFESPSSAILALSILIGLISLTSQVILLEKEPHDFNEFLFHVQSALQNTISIFIVGFMIWLLMPNPTAFSSYRYDENKARNASHVRIDFLKEMQNKTPKTGDRYLVIGGGFVGKKLVHALLLRGETQITVFDMDPHAMDMFKNDSRVKFIRGNVLHYDQVLSACQNIDTVWSTFAIIRFMERLPHQLELSRKINVDGTINVIRACKEAKVKNLIQTSTSNVCISKASASLYMNEETPYVTSETSLNHYGYTKAEAEKLVLTANSSTLRTVACRPCSAVFGAADRHLLQPLLENKWTFLPPDGGRAITDFVYVQNVVWAHLLCEVGLREKPTEVAGKAFCFSNGQAMRFVDLLHIVNWKYGLTRIPSPENIVYILGWLNEQGQRLFKYHPPGRLELVTSAMFEFLAIDYAFSNTKAKKILGYEPLYSVEEALDHAMEEFKQGKFLPVLQ
jgi:sterol-4alpha-carboxylate 3-dehydrogenase (decarboxylating)